MFKAKNDQRDSGLSSVKQVEQRDSTNCNSKARQSRFHLNQKLSSGSFGVVFSGKDRETGTEIVLKINNDQNMNKIESNVLKVLNKNGFKNFPQMIQTGKFHNRPGIVLEKFGMTLEKYFQYQNRYFSFKTQIQIGIQLVTLME